MYLVHDFNFTFNLKSFRSKARREKFCKTLITFHQLNKANKNSWSRFTFDNFMALWEVREKKRNKREERYGNI